VISNTKGWTTTQEEPTNNKNKTNEQQKKKTNPIIKGIELNNNTRGVEQTNLKKP
jgi:hypothetical protein